MDKLEESREKLKEVIKKGITDFLSDISDSNFEYKFIEDISLDLHISPIFIGKPKVKIEIGVL